MSKNRVKGTYDVFPGAEDWKNPAYWQYLEAVVSKITRIYGFKELRTPIFEHTEVFTRAVGNETDIGSKEMYTFEDRGRRSLSLKPEGTASLVRAYIENSLHQSPYDRFYYMGPYFRYDRPQKGRFRQFNQFGVEVIGRKDPFIDVEVMSMAHHFYKELGISGLTMLVNSIGTPKAREIYIRKFQDYLKPHLSQLSEESQKRVDTNPLRVLDSKSPKDIEITKGAPKILDDLDVDSRKYFDTVCNQLAKFDIPFTVETSLVRGLDYYTETVFEVVDMGEQGAQSTLCAGGRYDGLCKLLGGPDVPGIGFALGIERTLAYLMEHGNTMMEDRSLTAYIIPMSDAANEKAMELIHQLRQKGVGVRRHEKNMNLKKGLQEAEKLSAKYAIILGEEEVSSNTAKIKHLESHDQKEVSIDSLSDHRF